MRDGERQQLLEILWPPNLPGRVCVWAIIDAARDARIFGAVDDCRLEKCCLYSGPLPWQLQFNAPYLVMLEKDDQFTRYLLRSGWSNGWCVFLRTDSHALKLRTHLHGFLRVMDEDARKLLFRYYDPWVFRTFLPTCQPEELAAFFGPVQSYLAEGDDENTAFEFSIEGEAVVERRFGIGDSRPPERHILSAVKLGTDRRPILTKIRREQMAALGAATLRRFEDRAVAHLRATYPETVTTMGQPAVADSVRAAMAKVQEYGLGSGVDIIRYLNLMYTLGFDFDRNARFPWVQEILEDRELDPGCRMAELVDRTRREIASFGKVTAAAV